MARQDSLKMVLICVSLIGVTLLSGCTNWKKKYNALNVEHKNLKGLMEYERGEAARLSGELAQGQQTINELQKKIQELNQSPGEATGFGADYDVRVDAAAGTVTVTLRNDILFSPGFASLKKGTSVELNHIISVLKSQYAGSLIDVVGHTDSDPIKKSKWKDNWELSAQRSLTVTRYLVKGGITDSKVRAIGRGATVPVAPNNSSSNKAKNRRVEIVVHLK